MAESSNVHPDTRCVHAPSTGPRPGGSLTQPIYNSTVFEFGGASGREQVLYPRYHNTPAHVELGLQLAALEKTEDGVVTGSGMSAILAGLLSVVKAGDHVLALDSLYGGTMELLRHQLPRMGIEVDFFSGQRAGDAERLVKPGRTRLVYGESITNPVLEVPDLEGLVALAKRHGLVSMIDSTFATPMNFHPIALGFDLVMHSATKYLNGHSDLNAGVLVGRRELIDEARRTLKRCGGALDPNSCFLLARGLKTLALRMSRHNQNAMTAAMMLAEHPRVHRTLYPGLPCHPQHARAARLFAGGGGMIAIELKPAEGLTPAETAEAFLSRLKLIVPATSLGGVESIICRPAVATHGGLTAEERARAGIGDALLRLSVGVENAADLVGDLKQALAG